MEEAIEMCRNYSGTDLPGRLKIASISSHLTNLAHHGHTLITTLARAPHSPAAVHSPSSKSGSWGRRSRNSRLEDDFSASELAIRETTENLQKIFDQYKTHFERRVMPQSAPSTSKNANRLPKASESDSVFEEDHSKVKAKVEKKDGSLNRRHTESSLAARGSVSSVGVKDQIAVLNQKSKVVEEAPPPNPGISYTIAAPNVSRGRSKAVDEVVLNQSPSNSVLHNTSMSSEDDSPSLRRRGLSKEERIRKIEDIKMLFESSELMELTEKMSEQPAAWSPRTSSLPRRSPAHSSSGRDNHNKVHVVERVSVEECVRDVVSPTPVIMVSPPPPPVEDTPRTCLHTAPTVIRTVIKDHTPPPKHQVITLTHSNSPPEAKQDVASEQTAKEQVSEEQPRPEAGVASPEDRSPVSQNSATQTSKPAPPTTATPASKARGRGWGVLTGKVSSLREMFDSQSKTEDSSSSSNRDSMRKKKKDQPTTKSSECSTGSLSRRDRERDSCEPVLSPETIEDLSLSLSLSDRSASGMSQRRGLRNHDDDLTNSLDRHSDSSMSKALSSTIETGNMVTDQDPEEIQSAQSEPSNTEDSRELYPESPPRPRLPSPSVLTPSPQQTPPPRPPTPGYYQILDESGTSFSEMEDSDSLSDTSCPSESDSSHLDDSDLEWLEDQTLEWNEDDKMEGEDLVDLPSMEPRPLKSLTLVLQEIIATEGAYMRSLEVLVEKYYPLLASSPNLPSFLQGAHTRVLSNILDLYDFQK